MRYNYHQELWVLWGTTTIRNCGYYEVQLPSEIVGIMRYNYNQELWVLWDTTTIRNCGYYEVQLPSGIVGIMRHNFLWYLQRFTLLSNVKKTKNVNVYNIFIYELNKRIDEIKNHSMNNSFFQNGRFTFDFFFNNIIILFILFLLATNVIKSPSFSWCTLLHSTDYPGN
jgi:hypothetical protein